MQHSSLRACHRRSPRLTRMRQSRASGHRGTWRRCRSAPNSLLVSRCARPRRERASGSHRGQRSRVHRAEDLSTRVRIRDPLAFTVGRLRESALGPLHPNAKSKRRMPFKRHSLRSCPEFGNFRSWILPRPSRARTARVHRPGQSRRPRRSERRARCSRASTLDLRPRRTLRAARSASDLQPRHRPSLLPPGVEPRLAIGAGSSPDHLLVCSIRRRPLLQEIHRRSHRCRHCPPPSPPSPLRHSGSRYSDRPPRTRGPHRSHDTHNGRHTGLGHRPCSPGR